MSLIQEGISNISDVKMYVGYEVDGKMQYLETSLICNVVDYGLKVKYPALHSATLDRENKEISLKKEIRFLKKAKENHPLADPSVEVFNNVKRVRNLNDDQIDHIMKVFSENFENADIFTLGKYGDGLINLKRKRDEKLNRYPTFPCKACCRNHDHQDGYLVVDDRDKIFFCCRAYSRQRKEVGIFGQNGYQYVGEI